MVHLGPCGSEVQLVSFIRPWRLELVGDLFAIVFKSDGADGGSCHDRHNHLLFLSLIVFYSSSPKILPKSGSNRRRSKAFNLLGAPTPMEEFREPGVTYKNSMSQHHLPPAKLHTILWPVSPLYSVDTATSIA